MKKLTIKEAMKELEHLASERSIIIREESINNSVSYTSGEEKQVSNYDIDQVSKQLADLDKKMFDLKIAIHKANYETETDFEKLTIAKALVKLVQLQANYARYTSLSSVKQVTRSSGIHSELIEFTEQLYDVSKAKLEAEKYRKLIANIQVAIDKANILTYITI
jgi:hypothetical protein